MTQVYVAMVVSPIGSLLGHMVPPIRRVDQGLFQIADNRSDEISTGLKTVSRLSGGSISDAREAGQADLADRSPAKLSIPAGIGLDRHLGRE